MNLFKRWLWPHSARSDAISLYKQALACGERNDFRGAKDAYTLAIELLDAPDDVKAMALYNRALVLAASGAIDQAVADLKIVMELPGSLHTVKLAARRRLERLKNRHDAAARPTGRPTQ